MLEASLCELCPHTAARDEGDESFLPGFAENSLCPKEALAAGLTLTELLDRIIAVSINGKATARI